MKDLDINFPFDKFEKLIIDIGWESLDDWFKFWTLSHSFSIAVFIISKANNKKYNTDNIIL